MLTVVNYRYTVIVVGLTDYRLVKVIMSEVDRVDMVYSVDKLTC
jgi:hypothetical protein